MAAANSARPHADHSRATSGMRQALTLLERASIEWQNGDPRVPGPLHWRIAVTVAQRELRQALEALEDVREGADPPICICGRERIPSDCLDSPGWDTDDAREGLAWYNSATVAERRHWHLIARSAVPADAWEAYKAGGPQP
jgi:hypothetical protein